MRTTSYGERVLRLLWAILFSIGVSTVGFFLMTAAVFSFSPGSPYSYGNSGILIQFGCHYVTAAEIQAVRDFYQFNEPTYIQYFAWLTHALTGQWQPQLPGCQLQLPADSSQFYFEVGMLFWIVSTVALLTYSFVNHRARPLDSFASHATTSNLVRLAQRIRPGGIRTLQPVA